MTTSSTHGELPVGACSDAESVSHSQLAGNKGKPYIVVSDVHLGDERCCAKDFGEFLDWLYDSIKVNGKLKVRPSEDQKTNAHNNDTKPDELDAPQTLILLGDILELWAPKDNDRRKVITDSLRVFGKLMDLPCCEVYVLGNHDMTVFGWKGFETGVGRIGNTNALTPFDLACKNGCHFKTRPRYYPCNHDMWGALLLSLDEESPDTTTEKTKATYLFVHGQQFDPTFKAAGNAQKLVPLLAGLASAFEAYDGSGPAFFAGSLVTLGMFAAGVWIGPLPPLFWLAVGIFCGYPGFSWFITKHMKRVWDGLQQFTALVARAPCIKTSDTVPSWPWPMPPRSKIRYGRIDYDDIRNGVLDPNCIALEEDAIDKASPDKMVVVYGHTHVPALSHLRRYGRLQWEFVNTGSWLQPLGQEKRKENQRRFKKDCPDARDQNVRYNTFVYIGDQGPRLFEWKGMSIDPEEIPQGEHDSPPVTGG